MAVIADSTPSAVHPFLRPLHFPGGGRLPARILPGPMEGIMSGSFCGVLARLGYTRCWLTPFIRVSTAVPRPARLARRLRPFQATGLPVSAQIMGTRADLLVRAAERLASLGVVAVDLNCACPSPTVVRSGAGGERLLDPDWIHAVLSGMRQALPDCGVTVKLRTGFQSDAELPGILAAAAAARPDAVILHYRTVAEQYRPVEAGWRRLAVARDLLPTTVLIGSGDLFTVDDALTMHRNTGVDGVAPARGLLRNPRLLLDIEDACEGRKGTRSDRAHSLRVLRDIVRASEQFPDGPPGFALELAGHMLGRGQADFQALTRCRHLQDAARMLERFIHELEKADDS